MATAITIIKRAMRLIRILDPNESMRAEDAADALESLNAMLAEWHEAEIGLPDYSLATLETELASDVADREAIAYALAIRIAPEYEDANLSPTFMASAVESMARLRLRYFQPGATSFAELPGTAGAYNINTDE